MPVGSDLHYTAVNADVTATGIQNAVDIEVVNGNVILENSGSHIEVESVNGGSANVDISTVHGRIEIDEK